MNPAKRKTLWIVTLLACVLVWLPLAYLRMAKLRDDARRAASDFAHVRLAIADIQRRHASPGRATAAPTMEATQLTQTLRAAAAAAGLPDAPGSEPGNPRRVGNTDYAVLPVNLQLESLTLRQLTLFLHTLGQIDPGSRPSAIELFPPNQPGPPNEERWRADVEVGWLTYSPRKR